MLSKPVVAIVAFALGITMSEIMTHELTFAEVLAGELRFGPTPKFEEVEEGVMYDVTHWLEMYDTSTGEPVYWVLAQKLGPYNFPGIGEVHKTVGPVTWYKVPRSLVSDVVNTTEPDRTARRGTMVMGEDGVRLQAERPKAIYHK